MSFKKILRGAVVGLACWGMVAPQAALVAQENVTRRTQMNDVSLAKSGVLRGRVVDAQGKAVAGAKVAVGFAGRVVARTVTDDNGNYAVMGLRGGLHQVVTSAGSSTVRLWADGTAPATARGEVLTVAGKVVRGQEGYMMMDDVQYAPGGYVPPPHAGFGMLDVITLATVGTSAAALIYALDNNDKLDDLEDAVASP